MVQALGTLGVRLSGLVERAHFEDAKTQALANTRALQIESHPDRHSTHGERVTATATALFQSISLADHLLRSSDWYSVAHLFSAPERRSTADRWGVRCGEWPADVPRPTTRQGTRFYARCPVCGVLVGDGERHSCRVDVDHFNTKSRPFSYERPKYERKAECRNESPLGAFCMLHQGHDGRHQGYGSKGRHTWHVVRPDYTEEHVQVGETE